MILWWIGWWTLATAQSSLPSAMIFVEGGRYEMGDRFLTGEEDELPVRNVHVASFYLSRYETTFEEFDQFVEETWCRRPDDHGFGRERHPVICVSWYDAILFCNWRSQKEGLTPCYSIDKLKKDPNNLGDADGLKWTVKWDKTANGYRLPTEAEWEYAARGGKKMRNYIGAGGNLVDTVGWHLANAKIGTRDVGLKKPNELYFFDMSGNVGEWCWDWYAPNYTGLENDNPIGPTSGSRKVVRGGGWDDLPTELRVSARRGEIPDRVDLRSVGFRMARSSF
jgi:formylglycine-generating enzyme required for sulfatase activity